MATQQGTAHQFGTAAAVASEISLTIYDTSNTSLGSAYVVPTIEGWTVNHTVQSVESRNGSGEVDGVATYGETLEMTLNVLPKGSTLADARKSATLPPHGSTVVIANAPVIAVGGWSDAVNVGGSAPNTHRWIYLGGGSINTTNEGFATLSLPLKRYASILATSTPITT